MGTLYLTEQNSYLRRTSQRLVVELNGETLAEIPAIKVERVLVFGNVQISTQALHLLLNQGIDTSLLSYHGKIYGRLVPVENKNIYLRLSQYKAYHDSAFRLCFAKNIVQGKLLNGRRLLQRLSYGRKMDMEPVLREMSRYAQAVQQCTDLDQVRGYEGKGTAAYFHGFGQLIKGFDFCGRNRRPPRDPVNSLLSFGYTLLAGEVLAALAAGGLDPYLGFFHEVKYGRTALCFDLCEEFRHLVVDGLVLDWVNHEKVKAEDFTEDPESKGLLLSPEMRKQFLAAFEKKMTELRKNTSNKSINYRKSIHDQVDCVRHAIQGNTEYTAYRYT
ncbi:MAG: CRISPR-associated endonuclease Cas1 [bacterium]|jgi:CRISPR-associated protein Cas1